MRYAFNVNLTTEDDGTYLYPFPSVVYQVVGFDIANIEPEGVVSVYNPIITDAESVAKCRTFRGKLPKYEAKSSIDSNAVNNVCIFTELDRIYYGGSDVGKCFCDKPAGGKACDAPAVTSNFGKGVCNFLGDEKSMAITPIGTRVKVRNALPDDEAGVFSFPLDGKVGFGCKIRDVGKSMRTRLQQDSPNDYVKIFTFQNTYDAATFVLAPPLFATMTLATATASAFAAQTVLASWVTAEEAADVVATLATATMSPAASPTYVVDSTHQYLPIFIDLVARDEDTDGDADVVWTTRGFPFARCTTRATCGDTITDTTIVCGAGNYTVELCDVINEGNVFYESAGNFKYDGSMVSAAAGTLLELKALNVASHVYIMAPSTTTFVVFSGTCTLLVSNVFATSNLAHVYSCPAAGASTHQFTVGGTQLLIEVQAFDATDSNRGPFYPHV